jgi:hypothetical protein
MKNRARAIQKLSGCRYTAALHQLRSRGRLIWALRKLHPEMTMHEADAAICFEDDEDLKQRWGRALFDEGHPTTPSNAT